MQTIGGFLLKNGGWFLCNGKLRYLDSETGATSESDLHRRLAINQTEIIRPPRDQTGTQSVALHIYVMWGISRDCGTYFHYEETATDLASYEITGTTFFSTVHYRGLVKAG